MQDSPGFGEVDGSSGEHGVPAGFQFPRFGQVKEHLHNLGGDPVLGIVEQDLAIFWSLKDFARIWTKKEIIFSQYTLYTGRLAQEDSYSSLHINEKSLPKYLFLNS